MTEVHTCMASLDRTSHDHRHGQHTNLPIRVQPNSYAYHTRIHAPVRVSTEMILCSNIISLIHMRMVSPYTYCLLPAHRKTRITCVQATSSTLYPSHTRMAYTHTRMARIPYISCTNCYGRSAFFHPNPNLQHTQTPRTQKTTNPLDYMQFVQ